MRRTKANNRRNIEEIRKKKMQDQGVTMVALVVTIIILLILSGITIRFVVGDDGLIGQAKEAKLKYQNSALQEQLLLNSIEGQIASSSNGSNNNNSNNGSGTDNGNGSGGGNSDGNGEDNSDKMDELNKEIEELKRQIDLLKDYQTAGDAREEDVLAGKTFSCSAGIGLTGTMPNNGTLNITLTPSGNNTATKTIDEGYYSGGTIIADGSAAYSAGYTEGYSAGYTDSENNKVGPINLGPGNDDITYSVKISAGKINWSFSGKSFEKYTTTQYRISVNGKTYASGGWEDRNSHSASGSFTAPAGTMTVWIAGSSNRDMYWSKMTIWR